MIFPDGLASFRLGIWTGPFPVGDMDWPLSLAQSDAFQGYKVITFPSPRLHWVMVNLGTESGKVIIKVACRANTSPRAKVCANHPGCAPPPTLHPFPWSMTSPCILKISGQPAFAWALNVGFFQRLSGEETTIPRGGARALAWEMCANFSVPPTCSWLMPPRVMLFHAYFTPP